jgi:kinetochor protein Mis14/NSL1
MASSSNPARKIELQSPSDLTHLISVAQIASSQKLAESFPVSAAADGDGPDGMRAQVAALLDRFLDQTYTGVRQNILVNGVSADASQGDVQMDAVEDYEPFDGKLAEKIRMLEERKEQLTERIAELRREGPQKAADKWRGDWETEQSLYAVKEDDKEQVKAGAEGVPELLNPESLSRWEDVQATYAKALDGVLALKTGMSGTVGNLEEARKVGESLQTGSAR